LGRLFGRRDRSQDSHTPPLKGIPFSLLSSNRFIRDDL
jgi:hypothetical protein